jgi:stalled ribosome rescue protein Dom34
MRGITRTDYKRRTVDENARRHRKEVVDTLEGMAGDDGGVVLAGTTKAISAVRRDLEAKLAGRIVEAPELSFDSTRGEIEAAVRASSSTLTRMRQARLFEACAGGGDRASRGWNQTYRALAAGAVDTLLVARGTIEASPDDAERLARPALASGADVEEIGEDLGERLMAEAAGVAARLRFRVPA